MKLPRKFLLSAMLALSTPFVVPSVTWAADHGDAPSMAHDQGADIADLFFFLDPNDNTKAILIGTVHGFIVPGEAANFGIFDPVLRYRIEIENTGDAVADKFIDVTFNQRTGGVDPAGAVGKEALEIPFAQTATIKIPKLKTFAGGTFTAPVLNPSLGSTANPPTSTELKFPNQTDAGVEFFAGEVDDPFFFDIPGFSRFIKSVREGSPDGSVLSRGRDSFGGYNILAIALRINASELTKTGTVVGARFATQRRTLQTPTGKGEILATGAFKTVDSIGNPAVNVALVPFSKKNAYNATAPEKAGAKFAGDIVATLTALGTNANNLGILASVAVTKGDYLHLDTAIPNLPTDKIGGGKPGEGSGFPNGRRLRDDTVDILLSLIANGNPTAILGGQYNLGDGTNASISQFPQTATFPFLAPAQQPVASVDPANPTATDDKTQN